MGRHDERRGTRRIPLGVPARIMPDDQRPAVVAECVELSVGGMTLHSDYVPGEGERMTVEVAGAEAPLMRPPMRVRLEVKRCHRLRDSVYEIGGAIVEVIS